MTFQFSKIFFLKIRKKYSNFFFKELLSKMVKYNLSCKIDLVSKSHFSGRTTSEQRYPPKKIPRKNSWKQFGSLLLNSYPLRFHEKIKKQICLKKSWNQSGFALFNTQPPRFHVKIPRIIKTITNWRFPKFFDLFKKLGLITICYRHKIVRTSAEKTESSTQELKGVFTGVKRVSEAPVSKTSVKMANRVPACVIDVGTG